MEIEFWENSKGEVPVLEFVRAQNPKSQKKIFKIIGWFKKYGLNKFIDSGYGDKLKGTEKKYGRKIYQLIIGHYRILFGIIERVAWLVNGFIKKGKHTPKKEIKIANERIIYQEKKFINKQIN
jgi:phage-related protein